MVSNVTDDIARIAEELSEDQRTAWKNAAWEDGYHLPPWPMTMDATRRAMDMGLLSQDEFGWSVTWLGDHLIAHLNRPSLFVRILKRVRHLLASAGGEK